jgi:ferrochelatase
VDANRFDSVLLMAFGGPEHSGEIRPFLDNVLRGLPVPRERYEAVVHHYERIGGRSPLRALTARQAAALRTALATAGAEIPVYVGMRFAKPFLYSAIRDMIRDGSRRAVGIVLAPYRSEPSFEKYHEAVTEVLRAAGTERAPRVEFVAPWFDHPLFADAQADQVRTALTQIPQGRAGLARLVFTAHSIPIRVAERGPYVAQIRTACANVAAALGRPEWDLAWQSRSGDPRTPWLAPDLVTVLHQLQVAGFVDVVICPIGFVADHVEVLYDLDIEAAEAAAVMGLNFVRAATVNDHPSFIRALAELVHRATRGEGLAATAGPAR